MIDDDESKLKVDFSYSTTVCNTIIPTTKLLIGPSLPVSKTHIWPVPPPLPLSALFSVFFMSQAD